MSEPPKGSTDDLTRSVVNVVDAAFGVGVALAKTAARATAQGREPAPPANDAAIPAIIHYSLATATNVVGLVTAAVNAGGRAAASATASAASASSSASAGGPRIRPGGTLRVPLSIENPGDRPMTGLSPLTRAVRHNGAATSALTAKDVRFAPADFEVAPRDFEKLTVFVTVPAAAPTGRYEVTLALNASGEDLPLAFEVVTEA